MKDADLVTFLQWALPRMHMRWRGFRGVRGQVCKRITRRIAELGLADVAAYRARLERDTGTDEWRVLERMCAVTISRFYRDRAVFDFLRAEVVPELARDAIARGEPSLRAWSAGCASGEEPYTLAMLWRFDLASRFPRLGFRVVASDVGDEVIVRARRGVYEAGSLRELPAGWQGAGFDREGSSFSVREELRSIVELRREDIREHMPNAPLHLVCCRNLVFTYFDEPAQRAFAARIAARMAPRGALVIGSHESLPPDLEGFAPSAHACVRYRS
jgi:chemotaxis protein methyltransferase CheR